jgi:asparagine synthase (glutamine-hydrolysing)
MLPREWALYCSVFWTTMPAIMCGFAGEFLFASTKNPGQADVALACRMAERLVHRGPDEEGKYLSPDGRCAIGFRRLAVIDPAGSHQPMTSEDGLVTVAFNGEIYNFRRLRAELTVQGCRFRTAGDTEVLLHLYRRDGLEMLKNLDGMFAFAIHDAQAGTLLLARDRLGEKPLWYAMLPDRIVFASEAKALLVHPQVGSDIDYSALTYYLTVGYIPAPASAYLHLRKLPPACRMLVGDRGAAPERYWQLGRMELPASRRDLLDLVQQRVLESVSSRMVADVPLGALLSGGIDSSIVVAAMSLSAGAAGGVKTFTAGFSDDQYDERPAAAAVARHCGTEHTELLVQPAPRDVVHQVDKIVSMYDEPFGDSSALPTWLISQATRQQVTVALTGDGGDETFGGYDRYRALHLASTISPVRFAGLRLLSDLVRPWASHDERNRLRRLIRFTDAMMHPFSIQYFMYRRLFGPQDLLDLLSDEALQWMDVEAPARWFCDLYEDAEAPDEVSAAQLHDLATYLPDDLLVKTDIASMTCSLELRCPMLDHRLVELGLSLPLSDKITGRRGKAILREVFGHGPTGWLPEEVFRRPKRGFGVPLGRWFREDLRPAVEDFLLAPSGAFGRMFRPQALAGLVNDHLSGRGDHGHRLWALLVLARWMEGIR